MNSNSHSIIDDDQILIAFRKDRNLGLQYLYDKYLHVIYGVCLKYLKNKPEAQDATSDLFEKFTKIDIPTDISQLKAWLFVVTKNHCLMILRKSKPETFEINQVDFMDFSEEMHPIDKALQQEKELDVLLQCIEQLKNEQKACIDLFYLKKQCYQEVAEKTGHEIKKVKSYIQNGKRNLKICIESNDL